MEMLRIIVSAKFLLGLNFLENISVRRRYISMEVRSDILALFNKTSEINEKSFFSAESKEQH